MAGSPKWKIYRGKDYIGCVKYAEDAAALVSVCSYGTVKYDHSLVVWREGHEEIEAGASYDRAAEIMNSRLKDHQERAFAASYGYSA